MASLNGAVGTMLAPPPPPEPVKLVSKERKTREYVIESNCDGCGAPLSGKDLRHAHDWVDLFTGWTQDPEDTLCLDCARILSCAEGHGLGSTSGVRETLQKLEAIREAGMLVMLKTVHLGTDAGAHVKLDFGDVFKVARVSAEPRKDKPNRERSMQRFSVDVNVGPIKCTLWPREVAPMRMLTVLALQREGDYAMAYVSTEDHEGYFTLTPKAKELCVANFGER